MTCRWSSVCRACRCKLLKTDGKSTPKVPNTRTADRGLWWDMLEFCQETQTKKKIEWAWGTEFFHHDFTEHDYCREASPFSFSASSIQGPQRDPFWAAWRLFPSKTWRKCFRFKTRFFVFTLCTIIKRQPGDMSVSAQCRIINPCLNFCIYLCSTLTLA